MSHDTVVLLLVLSLVVGATMLCLWAANRLGFHQGTVHQNPRPPPRPSRRVDKDEDLIDKLRRVRWAQATMRK